MEGRSQKQLENLKQELEQVLSKQLAEQKGASPKKPHGTPIPSHHSASEIERQPTQKKDPLSAPRRNTVTSDARFFKSEQSVPIKKRGITHQMSAPILTDDAVNQVRTSIDQLKKMIAMVPPSHDIPHQIQLFAQQSAQLPENIVVLKMASLIPFFNSTAMRPYKPYLLAQLEIAFSKTAQKAHYHVIEELKTHWFTDDTNGQEYQAYCNVFFHLLEAEPSHLTYEIFFRNSTGSIWTLYFRALCSRLVAIASTVFSVPKTILPMHGDAQRCIDQILMLINKEYHVNLEMHHLDLAKIDLTLFQQVPGMLPFMPMLKKHQAHIDQVTRDLAECYHALILQHILDHLKMALAWYPQHFLDYKKEMGYIERHIRSYTDPSLCDERSYLLLAIKIMKMFDKEKKMESDASNALLHFIMSALKNHFTISDIQKIDAEGIGTLLRHGLMDQIMARIDLEQSFPNDQRSLTLRRYA